MFCQISFRKFSDVLPAFTCASIAGNLCSICLGVILSCLWLRNLQSDTLRSEILATQATESKILGSTFRCFPLRSIPL